ncbi:uncharacterized protein LOC106162737 [Lingula anatina]|uniref:Uncharacterized protein LOC106162737 n=1 Tax=Lingula anatina TaxID=7574 RepID=A0A1S3IDR7_LINAN|nr:uncharacterized protein LOC106162737 [Lingula anatina]|eukprot:XP_013395594.1 uncharacterized protein LOC106162737 [Lingula anatina]
MATARELLCLAFFVNILIIGVDGQLEEGTHDFLAFPAITDYQKGFDFVNDVEYAWSQNEISSRTAFHNFLKKKYGHISAQARRRLIGDANIQERVRKHNFQHSVSLTHVPGNAAEPFKLSTVNGWMKDEVLVYPSPLFHNSSILFHAFNPHSGFLDALWNSNDSLASAMSMLNSTPVNVHYVFLAQEGDALSMAGLLIKAAHAVKRPELLSNLHFALHPVYKLGNWIPGLLKEWQCQDHGCGLDQLVLDDKVSVPEVLMRLDAHYDWLPSPVSVFGNKSMPVRSMLGLGNGCRKEPSVKGMLAYVLDGSDCSYFDKISSMEASGAAGVIVQAQPNNSVFDMKCVGKQCDVQLSIPATVVRTDNTRLMNRLKLGTVMASFQNTPSDNFYVGIDNRGLLAETGWFLYPSLQFLAWQAQWFSYRQSLDEKLSHPCTVIPVFNHTRMQGAKGAVATVKLPNISGLCITELRQYSRIELDMSLSCPGTRDVDCAHWDHTVQLYVCCNRTDQQLCNAELGRWISPFRRRIGRWLTDVSSLRPLLESSNGQCTLTMKTAPWALPWMPSLNLRLCRNKDVTPTPSTVQPLWSPGATFDKNYNKHFQPFSFNVQNNVKKVGLVSVITGHGSDENGCGEFCPTSHHFVVNGKTYSRTFDTAGTPLGCADRVPQGVTPNEHGTWLYGRDGWCDGQQVDPWVIDVTSAVKIGQVNTVTYYGWYKGGDPNPQHNPGVMIFYSYLVTYT